MKEYGISYNMKKYRVSIPVIFYKSFLVDAEDPDSAIVLAKRGVGEDEGTLVPEMQHPWKCSDEIRSSVTVMAKCGAIEADRVFTEEEKAQWTTMEQVRESEGLPSEYTNPDSRS